MRRWFLAAAATLLTAAAITTAGALPLGPGAARPAVETINPVEQTACWRWGWRGWGWYPCWGAYHGGPYYYHHWRHPYGMTRTTNTNGTITLAAVIFEGTSASLGWIDRTATTPRSSNFCSRSLCYEILLTPPSPAAVLRVSSA